MMNIKYRIEGDKIYLGSTDLYFISFYNPITSVEPIDKLPDLKINTTHGVYILRDVDKIQMVRVISLEGKTIEELQREHYPHLYNEDGTWKGVE